MKSGTLSDKLAAMTLEYQEEPLLKFRKYH